jgi:H+/Cl- antiporter ClcA
MNELYGRSSSYWAKFGWGILTGTLSALGALLFVALMNLGLKFLWPQTPGFEPFSGSVRILIIMAATGVIIGIIHRFVRAEEVNVFAAIVQGRLDPRPVPGALLVSLISLIGGFSLGPEVPTGMLAGGFATWFSERKQLADDVKHTNVASSVLSAYGGLFTSPFAVLLIPLEMAHKQTQEFYGNLIIAATAAVTGFAIFFAVAGREFAEVLRILDMPEFQLELWHLPVSVLLGLLGVLLAVIFSMMLRFLRRLTDRLGNRPVLLSTISGILLGLLGMALPLTLFLGTNGLVTVTNQAAELGLVLIIIMVFAKMLALAGALAGGFIGGPIFPMLFIGGAAGTAIHMIFPHIPLALCVSTMMVAVPSGFLPVPLGLSVIVMLIAGIPSIEAIPIFIAGLTAYFFTHALVRTGTGSE